VPGTAVRIESTEDRTCDAELFTLPMYDADQFASGKERGGKFNDL